MKNNCYRVIWQELEGQAILTIPGLSVAALPCTGRKTSKSFVAFNLNSRKELCQLTKDEVTAWLVGRAKDEQVPFNEFF